MEELQPQTNEHEVMEGPKITPSPKNKGRKRKKDPETWKKTIKKQKQYTSKSLPKLPQCVHSDKVFKCDQLTMQDVRKFHGGFYSSKNKIDQDNYILKYTLSETPKWRRTNEEERKQNTENWNRYLIPHTKFGNTTLLQVCKKSFCGVLSISEKRAQRVCKRHFHSRKLATENRGGNHKYKLFEAKRHSVKSFIESLWPLEKHYCRNTNVTRQYFASHLSISKFHKVYNSKVEDDLQVPYSYFYDIFVKDYNLSFGSPALDKCSKCIQFQLKLESGDKSVETEYTLHKKRADSFFSLLQTQNEDEITLSFDCQKNLVLPKIPDQAAYYSRQFYLYNFTICQGTSIDKQTKDNVFIYHWTESDFKKGSTEISSAVFHRLQNTSLQGVSTVRLFADGCAGQNRNSAMMCMLQYWLVNEAPANVKKICLIFPIPGHSYMPPDRVFGRIEKEILKNDTIIKPEKYIEIFNECGTVVSMTESCNIFDWKAVCENYQKKPKDWHFKFSSAKRFIITRGTVPTSEVLVAGEPWYNTNLAKAKKVIKPTFKVRDFQLPLLLPGVPVKDLKVKDVKKLLTLHFGEYWTDNEELAFYKNIICNAVQDRHDEQSEDENEGGLMDDENEF